MVSTDQFGIRVYYEDTDLAGIVYYANYLRFIERGRSEFLRNRNIDQIALRDQYGLVFAVTELHAHYRKPAFFDDWLQVETTLPYLQRARFKMNQKVLRDGETLFDAEVTLALLTKAGRPARLPPELRAQIAG